MIGVSASMVKDDHFGAKTLFHRANRFDFAAGGTRIIMLARSNTGMGACSLIFGSRILFTVVPRAQNGVDTLIVAVPPIRNRPVSSPWKLLSKKEAEWGHTSQKLPDTSSEQIGGPRNVFGPYDNLSNPGVGVCVFNQSMVCACRPCIR